MKYKMLHTKWYRHEPYFVFKGDRYLLNSYVKLTEYGKQFLDTSCDSVQLTEHFYMIKNEKEIELWKFVTRFIDIPPRPFTMSTNEPLEKLIEEVVVPVKYEPPNKKPDPVKVKNQDWEVPDVLFGWILVIVFFIGVEALKDWSLKLILRCVVGWGFGLWRQKRMIEEGYVNFENKKEDKK